MHDLGLDSLLHLYVTLFLHYIHSNIHDDIILPRTIETNERTDILLFSDGRLCRPFEMIWLLLFLCHVYCNNSKSYPCWL